MCGPMCITDGIGSAAVEHSRLAHRNGSNDTRFSPSVVGQRCVITIRFQPLFLHAVGAYTAVRHGLRTFWSCLEPVYQAGNHRATTGSARYRSSGGNLHLEHSCHSWCACHSTYGKTRYRISVNRSHVKWDMRTPS